MILHPDYLRMPGPRTVGAVAGAAFAAAAPLLRWLNYTENCLSLILISWSNLA